MRQHTFKPEICAESTKIHQESNKGDFLQRIARDAARKEHETVRQKVTGYRHAKQQNRKRHMTAPKWPFPCPIESRPRATATQAFLPLSLLLFPTCRHPSSELTPGVAGLRDSADRNPNRRIARLQNIESPQVLMLLLSFAAQLSGRPMLTLAQRRRGCTTPIAPSSPRPRPGLPTSRRGAWWN